MRWWRKAGRGADTRGRITSEEPEHCVCLCGRTIRVDRLRVPSEHGPHCALLALLETELVEPLLPSPPGDD